MRLSTGLGFACLCWLAACSRCERADREPAALSRSAPSVDCVRGQFTAFHGNLHSHTGHSDGEGTPAQAFDHARVEAGLDFLAVTDHLEQLYDWLGEPSAELETCQREAGAATEPNAFLALCGFEYGTGFRLFRSTGHNNVYFSSGLLPRLQVDFRDFYKSLASCEGCVGQFNHPARESDAQDWHDYEYHEEADRELSLFELNGGADTWRELIRALDAGWHVSPTYGQDNHKRDWGTKSEARTGVFLQSLTLPQLQQALVQRRTFATWDRNASVELRTADGCWMGSILQGRSSLSVQAVAADSELDDPVEVLSLHTNGGAEIAGRVCDPAGPCVLTATVAAGRGVYVLARAVEKDGDLLISAPIWAEP